jgi:putative transposase
VGCAPEGSALIYTAPTPDAAAIALEELDEKWGRRYGALIRLWRNAWEQFIPFLDYDVEIRKVICSTNAIESLNARYRRAVRARGHFPSVLDSAAVVSAFAEGDRGVVAVVSAWLVQ